MKIHTALKSFSFPLACLVSIFVLQSPCVAGNLFEPPDGKCYLGLSRDREMGPAEYDGGIDFNHSVAEFYMDMPFTGNQHEELLYIARDCAKQKKLLVLTINPWDPSKVTEDVMTDFAERVGRCDTPVLVNFAPEMNGSWYPWGQKPGWYKKTFRLLHDNLADKAPKAGMMWSPSGAYGYPYPGGEHSCAPDTPQFEALDTRKDSRLNGRDDMYGPYYPGNDVVDWVGMNVLYWGDPPYGDNKKAPNSAFGKALTGGGHSPRFYSRFCARGDHNKPLAVTGTGIFYDPAADKGPKEHNVKESWIRQVYNKMLLRKLDKLKMIIWFDHVKKESKVNADVDWRLSNNPRVVEYYLKTIGAEGRDRQQSPFLDADQADPFLAGQR